MKYYPSLSSLVSKDSLPVELGFLLDGLYGLFDHLFYQDLYISTSPGGEAVQVNLKIVSHHKLALEIPGTEGLALVLYPSKVEGGVTRVPISLGIRWEILRFLEKIDVDSLPVEPRQWLDFLFEALGIHPVEFLEEVIAHFSGDQADPYVHFLDNLPGETIILNEEADLSLLEQIQNGLQSQNIDLAQFAIEELINNGANPDEKLNRLARLMKRWIGELEGDQLVKLLIPRVNAAVHDLEAALEFPRAWLIPLSEGDQPLEAPERSRLLIKGGTLRFSTDHGLQFDNKSQLDFQKSEILQTGLTLEVTSMRLGNQRQGNLKEQAGTEASVLDMTIEEARIGLPSSWMVNQQGEHASLVGRNLKFSASEHPRGEILLDTSEATSLTVTLPGNVQVGFNEFTVVFGGGSVNGTIGGFLSIPGLQNATGDADAKFQLMANIEDTAYIFNASTSDGLRIADFLVSIDQCQVIVDHASVVDSTIEGAVTIPAFKLGSGEPVVLGISVKIQPDRYAVFTTADSFPQLRLSEFSVGLNTFGIEFSESGLLDIDMSGIIQLPGVKDESGANVSLEFDVEIESTGFRLAVNDPPPLKLDVFSLDLSTIDISFNKSGLTSLLLGGQLTIPGVQNEQGQAAIIDFDWETTGGVHSLVASNLPKLEIAGFVLSLSDCEITIVEDGMDSFIAKGALSVPGLEQPGGAPGAIGFDLVLHDGIFRIAVSDIPALQLRAVEIAIETIDLSFSKVGAESSELRGYLTIPGLTDEDDTVARIGFNIIAEAGAFILSALDLNALPPLRVGALALSLEIFQITFGGELPFSSSISGTIEISSFKTSAGESVFLDVEIDLEDGFGITATVPGGKVTIFDEADVVRVALFKLGFGIRDNGVSFAIGGSIENQLMVPMLEALIPSDVIVEDLSYDPEKREMDLDFNITWPNGLSIGEKGVGGFDRIVPVGEIGGGLSLEAVKLGLIENDTSYVFSLAFQGVVLNLGPLTGTVSGLGFEAVLEPRSENDGNIGPLQIDIDYLPATGLGLEMNSMGIVGGGYLDIDEEQGRYSGILQLSYGDIGLTAIGLIETKFPGSDKKGFAMLISIGVSFSPPVQLSFGFKLNAVGGLIGINRAMDTDVLRAGLRKGTLNSILLPEDAVVNASQIISEMRSVFPTVEGRFVIGPVIELGWGTPSIVRAKLGIFIELPDPVRIVILGQFKAALPSEDKVLIEFNLDVLGTIDFSRKFIQIEASLYDSHILSFTLSGDAAFRLEWGSSPMFVLSLGGFHPKFTPPSSFPALRRLSLALSDSENLQLSCSTYFALTSNSFQFGAHVQLYAYLGPIEADGEFSFDALFYFSPFAFDIEIGIRVAVKVKGLTLAGIELTFALSGPTPWNARGKASIKILFIKISGSFNITWGKRESIPVAQIDPWDHLKAALMRAESWGSRLPEGRRMAVSLRSVDAQPVTVSSNDDNHIVIEGVIIHPSGYLEVRQNVLPLNTTLELFGNASVKGHNKFSLETEKAEGTDLNDVPILEDFARGQFQQLSRDQKLTLPSFEKMRAGLSIQSNQVKLSIASQSRSIYYESIVIDEERVASKKKRGVTSWERTPRLLRGNAVARSAFKRQGAKKYSARMGGGKVRVGQREYRIVDFQDLGVQEKESERIKKVNSYSSRWEADLNLDKDFVTENEKLTRPQIISSFEVPHV